MSTVRRHQREDGTWVQQHERRQPKSGERRGADPDAAVTAAAVMADASSVDVVDVVEMPEDGWTLESWNNWLDSDAGQDFLERSVSDESWTEDLDLRLATDDVTGRFKTLHERFVNWYNAFHVDKEGTPPYEWWSEDVDEMGYGEADMGYSRAVEDWIEYCLVERLNRMSPAIKAMARLNHIDGDSDYLCSTRDRMPLSRLTKRVNESAHDPDFSGPFAGLRSCMTDLDSRWSRDGNAPLSLAKFIEGSYDSLCDYSASDESWTPAMDVLLAAHIQHSQPERGMFMQTVEHNGFAADMCSIYMLEWGDRIKEALDCCESHMFDANSLWQSDEEKETVWKDFVCRTLAARAQKLTDEDYAAARLISIDNNQQSGQQSGRSESAAQ